jgi:hypothetical protein
MQTGQKARQPRPDRAFWPGAGRGEILDQISTTLMRAGAVVVLTGGAAMGKTRLASEAAARVEAAAIRCKTATGDQRTDLIAIVDRMARPLLTRYTDTKARALLVVDQAERAGAQTLEQLILLAEQNSIAVMLIGRAELVGMLVRSVPEQVCDAVTCYVALEPLNEVQTAEFVTCRLGEETSPVTCGDDALRRIVAHSHGVPGVIDQLMTDALRLARLSRSTHLNAAAIDMIADNEHPVGEQRRPWRAPSGGAPTRTFPRQSANVPRSMQTILTNLQERPNAALDEDGREYGGQDDPTISERSNPSAELSYPPVRPTRRVLAWAGGMAFVVVATSVIALQHYLQSGAPVLDLTDRSRAVLSSLVGDTSIRPAVTSEQPAPSPVKPVSSAPETAAIMAETPMMQVAIVESPMLSPPMIDGEAKPLDVQVTVPEEAPTTPTLQALPITPEPLDEPVTEPTAEMAPDLDLSPMEPAATAQPDPEPPAPATEAIAPAEPGTVLEPPPEPTAQVAPEPELPAPSAEALSPSEPEAVPVEPPLPEPTAESTPEPELSVPSAETPLEQAPAGAATEMAPSDAAEFPSPESPSLESPPPESPSPESPAAEMSPPVEPASQEPPAAVAVPEPPLQETSPEQASPPEPEPAPEPAVAEPSPPPEPVAEPPAPEPAIVTAPPPPSPSIPAPVAPKPPSIQESVLLERGDRLLAMGDIASARLLYETAAAGGSARGALLAGRTLDPEYLRSLGTRGVTGDPALAAAWYEKAAKLGDDSATALLEALGRR